MLNDTAVRRRDELRRQMLSRRESLAADELETMSRLIAARLDDLEPLHNAQYVMGFASIRNEIYLAGWIKKQAQLGRALLLPRVEKNGQLEAVEFRGWEHTVAGPFGIREPVGEPFDPQMIDAVLVPGLVFDAQGYRLGYGKGYYDRFLPSLRQDAFFCGLCCDFQVVDNIYPHPGDIPVHYVMTEISEIAVNQNK